MKHFQNPQYLQNPQVPQEPRPYFTLARLDAITDRDWNFVLSKEARNVLPPAAVEIFLANKLVLSLVESADDNPKFPVAKLFAGNVEIAVFWGKENGKASGRFCQDQNRTQHPFMFLSDYQFQDLNGQPRKGATVGFYPNSKSKFAKPNEYKMWGIREQFQRAGLNLNQHHPQMQPEPLPQQQRAQTLTAPEAVQQLESNGWRNVGGQWYQPVGLQSTDQQNSSVIQYPPNYGNQGGNNPPPAFGVPHAHPTHPGTPDPNDEVPF